MRIFVFGDSHRHAIANAGIALNLDTFHGTFGPFTMARFATEGTILINFNCLYKKQETKLEHGQWALWLDNPIGWKHEKITDDDLVIYSFGEIDCRHHLCQPKNLDNYKYILDNIIPRYFDAMKSNTVNYNNLKTVVNCIVPASNQPPEKIKLCATATDLTPFIGSNEQRKEVVEYANLKIKEYCEKYKFIYFDIVKQYSDENGYLNREKSDGDVHIIEYSDIINLLKTFNV